MPDKYNQMSKFGDWISLPLPDGTKLFNRELEQQYMQLPKSWLHIRIFFQTNKEGL